MQTVLALALAGAILAGSPAVAAADAGKRLSVGVVVGMGSCWRVDAPDDDTCLGAPFQPELSYRPDERNELFVKLGFATGRTLDAGVAPWAADLEDDVGKINGRDIDHLLTAWYRHTVQFDDGGSLGATVGVIDATDYLDDNAYANDEFTQFMNVALVNGPNVFLPSYDKGVALDWRTSRWSLRGVYMSVTENDEGRGYDFYGAQLGLHVNTSIGPGNYRLIVDGTDREFLDPEGRSGQNLMAVMLSLDQRLSDALGAFVRFGRQDDSPAIDHRMLYSGGIQLGGAVWGRPADTVGLGYAHLDGGNRGLGRSRVLEAYYRLVVRKLFAVTGDVQRVADDLDGGSTGSYLLGLRLAVEF